MVTDLPSALTTAGLVKYTGVLVETPQEPVYLVIEPVLSQPVTFTQVVVGVRFNVEE
jgi:hypothetical protein